MGQYANMRILVTLDVRPQVAKPVGSLPSRADVRAYTPRVAVDLGWITAVRGPSPAWDDVTRPLGEAAYAAVVRSIRAPTFQERLVIEKNDLSDNVSKLDRFVATTAFDTLEQEDQDLLLAQRLAMVAYLDALVQRTARLTCD